MIILLLLGLIIFAFVRQFHGPNPARWTGRKQALAPIARYVAADLRATRDHLAHWVAYRRTLRRYNQHWSEDA